MQSKSQNLYLSLETRQALDAISQRLRQRSRSWIVRELVLWADKNWERAKEILEG